jgi:heme exporter protein D
MEVVITSNLFNPTECKIINYCRMFLRVHSIADLTLAGGKHVDYSFLALDPSLLSLASTLIESLQDRRQTASAL